MDNIKVFIFDRDKKYSLAIGEYISNYSKKYIVRILENEAEINKCFIPEKNSVLLTDDKEVFERISEEGNVILLSEVFLENVEDRNIVFKYTSSNVILKEINLILNKNRGNYYDSRLELKSCAISFFSLSGGTGKTSIAITVGRILASEMNKVLYVNMEEIPSTSSYFKYDEGKASFSDFLYYLFYKDGLDMAEMIQEYTFTDQWGLSCFLPSNNLEEVNNLNNADLDILIDILKTKSKYDYIIFDLSSTLSRKNKVILDNADIRFVVSENDSLYFNKYNTYINSISGEKDSLLIEKAIFIQNRSETSLQKDMIQVKNDFSSFEYIDEFVNIKMDGIFAKSVNKISQYIQSLSNNQ